MKRRRLKVMEQPPDGMMWNPSEQFFGRTKFIKISELETICRMYYRALDSGKARPSTTTPPWRNDPTYNLRKRE